MQFCPKFTQFAPPDISSHLTVVPFAELAILIPSIDPVTVMEARTSLLVPLTVVGFVGMLIAVETVKEPMMTSSDPSATPTPATRVFHGAADNHAAPREVPAATSLPDEDMQYVVTDYSTSYSTTPPMFPVPEIVM